MYLAFNNGQSSTKGNDLYIGFSTFIMMESKTTITVMALAIIAIGMMSAFTIFGAEDALGKSCPQHGCKGTHGYYTIKGHHHCYKGSKGCASKKHGYH